MKKTYEKPMVVIEEFTLSQHIAVACTIPIRENNSTILEGCSADVSTPIPSEGGKLFYMMLEGTACDADGSEFYCYINAADGSLNEVLFGS